MRMMSLLELVEIGERRGNESAERISALAASAYCGSALTSA
jgi:hypothetical protein